MLFRTLPVAPGCSKDSENEKTSGNCYRLPILSSGELGAGSIPIMSVPKVLSQQFHILCQDSFTRKGSAVRGPVTIGRLNIG